MTATVTSLPRSVAASSRAMLPFLVACGVYAVLMLAGDQLLRDPDSYWQVTVGNWILDHRAVPRTDVYSWTMQGAPWISTQWLAQVLFAAAHRLLGWSGPVLLATAAVAAAFGLLLRILCRRLSPIHALVLACSAFALTVPHLLARPHVLAMPIMIVFVGGLVDAMDRRGAPSFWLLPVMTLWANMHGGFVLGLALIGATGLGATWGLEPTAQRRLMGRWFVFGCLAVVASCVTPYGYESILASRRILNLGEALALIGEWRPADFGKAGPLEMIVLGGFGLALWRGFRLSPIRIALVLGMTFMALSHVRNAEVLALLAPLVLAKPLAARMNDVQAQALPAPRMTIFGLAVIMIAGTAALLATHRYTPHSYVSPVAAVRVLKERGITRVFNDYDFGGYLIAEGVAPYIDGRTELYGEKFMVTHNNFIWLLKPADFFGFLTDERIQATLLRTTTPAATMMDHLDGWQRIYGDDVAVIHIRAPAAAHTIAPALRMTQQ